MKHKKIIAAMILIAVMACTFSNVMADNVVNGIQIASRISIAGRLDAKDAGNQVTLLMLKSSANPDDFAPDDIGYVAQTAIRDDGSYAFGFVFNKNVRDYKILVNLSGENVTGTVEKAEAIADLTNATVDIQQENDISTATANIKNLQQYPYLDYKLAIIFFNSSGAEISREETELNNLDINITKKIIKAVIPDGTVNMQALLTLQDREKQLETMEVTASLPVKALIDIKVASNEKSAKGTLKLQPYGMKYNSYVMCLGFYDENGRLLLVKATGDKELNGTAAEDEVDVSDIPENTAKIKAFLWSNSKDMVPLCDTYEKKPAQEITCWGDSLTAGSGGNVDIYGNACDLVTYPMVLERMSGLKVNNMGAGGENARTIAARQGGLQILVDPVNIPADTGEVEVTLSCSDGGEVIPMSPQKNAGINICYLAGVAGNLRETAIRDANNAVIGHKYYFSRVEPGEAVDVTEKTVLITDGMKNRRKDILVIFSGQNKGYDDNNDTLISMQKSMADYLDYTYPQYVVVGLTTLRKENRLELESAQQAAFGERYINMREYLSSDQALIDGFGDEAHTTIEDVLPLVKAAMIEKYKNNGKESEAEGAYNKMISNMKTGLVPEIFLSDNVHFNNLGYELVGKYIYKRMTEIGILYE